MIDKILYEFYLYQSLIKYSFINAGKVMILIIIDLILYDKILHLVIPNLASAIPIR